MKLPVYVLPLIAMACSSASVVVTEGGTPDDAGDAPDVATVIDAAADAGTGGDAGADAVLVGAKFADVYSIIASKCGTCHTANSNGDLKMNSEEAAYAALVGVASTACAGNTRVIKGDADSSMLVKTLKGTAGCLVARMPKGRAPLSATEIATFESWINAGAER